MFELSRLYGKWFHLVEAQSHNLCTRHVPPSEKKLQSEEKNGRLPDIDCGTFEVALGNPEGGETVDMGTLRDALHKLNFQRVLKKRNPVEGT